jgi:hypothetical protein
MLAYIGHCADKLFISYGRLAMSATELAAVKSREVELHERSCRALSSVNRRLERELRSMKKAAQRAAQPK